MLAFCWECFCPVFLLWMLSYARESVAVVWWRVDGELRYKMPIGVQQLGCEVYRCSTRNLMPSPRQRQEVAVAPRSQHHIDKRDWARHGRVHQYKYLPVRVTTTVRIIEFRGGWVWVMIESVGREEGYVRGWLGVRHSSGVRD